MLPRKQNERSLHEIEMEEMRRQIQLLQETVKVQQALLEAHQRRLDDDNVSSSDSS
jgi:outer membrane protein TolC